MCKLLILLGAILSLQLLLATSLQQASECQWLVQSTDRCTDQIKECVTESCVSSAENRRRRRRLQCVMKCTLITKWMSVRTTNVRQCEHWGCDRSGDEHWLGHLARVQVKAMRRIVHRPRTCDWYFVILVIAQCITLKLLFKSKIGRTVVKNGWKEWAHRSMGNRLGSTCTHKVDK